MTKKVDRAVYGPSWSEVILGAFLSLFLGAAIGAALLVLRPVRVEKAEPKEREKSVVYFIEGSKDGAKARQALDKRKAFLAGQSVTVTEDEVNALLAPPPAPPAGKEKGKAKDAKDAKAEEAPPAPASNGYFTPGVPNVRLQEGVVQVGVPVTIDLLDVKVIAQARGGFEKQGDRFVFQPTEMYLGSCPVGRLPFLGGLVRDKLLAAQPIPDDIKAAWQKLASIQIGDKTAKLTMP